MDISYAFQITALMKYMKIVRLVIQLIINSLMKFLFALSLRFEFTLIDPANKCVTVTCGFLNR